MTSNILFHKLLTANLKSAELYNVQVTEKEIEFDTCAGINCCVYKYNFENESASYYYGDFHNWQRTSDKMITKKISEIVQATKLEIINACHSVSAKENILRKILRIYEFKYNKDFFNWRVWIEVNNKTLDFDYYNQSLPTDSYWLNIWESLQGNLFLEQIAPSWKGATIPKEVIEKNKELNVKKFTDSLNNKTLQRVLGNF